MMTIDEDNPKQFIRTDNDILIDIWDAVWKEDSISCLDLGSISIDVKDGVVYLDGYLAKENNLLFIDGVACSVAGVVAVHNNLVLDRDLIVQVTQSLARDKRTRPYILPVDAFHGWIHMGGEVPTNELQRVAEEVAGGVPGVRGVMTLPRVTGESPSKPRHVMQPRIGAVVYGENGDEGVVSQVVIQPDNQLVTHVVVRFKEIRDGNLEDRETVIPVQKIDLVNNGSIFLVRNGQPLNAYPALDPDNYPLALFTWKAPYPYTAGEVRWSLRQVLEGRSRPGSRLEKIPGTETEGVPNRTMAQASL